MPSKCPLLLQIDSTDPFYHAMVELHQERHEAYAERHGFEYRLDPIPSDMSKWWRIQAIYDALNTGSPFVAFLDADACIADMSVDLRDALPGSPSVGMCIHPREFGNNAQWHYNNGVSYWRNTPEAKTYLKHVLSFHGQSPYDQVPMNDLLLNDPLYAGLCQPLPQKWNQNVDHPALSAPVVAAWHGAGLPLERLSRMERWAKVNSWNK